MRARPMSVQDLSVLHRRYIEVSNRFRAVWTFHQFVQGLQKIFPEDVQISPALTKHMGEFQGIYNNLKQLSQKLNASEAGNVVRELDGIEFHLQGLVKAMLEEDEKVSASLCRQFFTRVKNYDDKILAQLVRFYILTQQTASWQRNRLDKVDFLLTKLAEEPDQGGAPATLRSPQQLKEVLNGLWAMFGLTVSAPEVAAAVREIDQIRLEVVQVNDFEELNGRGFVRRFRDYKSQLGPMFFQPEILLAILETNLVIRNVIRGLYQREEQRIVAEYQRVFELEREAPVDTQLDLELAQFHEVIESFERQLQEKNLRLEDLANIRQQVRDLLPRLQSKVADGPRVGEAVRSGTFTFPNPAPAGGRGSGSIVDELLASYFQQVVQALEGTDRDATPKAVTLMREIYPLRLEPREVIAHRRLAGRSEGVRELEHFLLEAAALRVRINEEAGEITGILDDTRITREAPVFASAKRTLRLADQFVRRFEHYLDQMVLGGDLVEAQAMQLLRMRLLRDYSGLWLLTHKG
jgi:hypothetical protein